MKVVGLLNWFQESPSWLATAVAGMARVCDTIVAVDGAYALYPGGRARSHPNEAEAIIGAAEAGGAGCLIYRPTSVWWGNEVAKRNQLIRFAGSLDLTDEDWLLVFDADIHVLQIDPEIVRAKLDAFAGHVATYTALDGKDFMTDAKLHEYVATRHCDVEWTCKTRDIFRYNPTLRVGPAHWTYSAVLEEGGKRVWVRGPHEAQVQDCLDLRRDLVVYHRTQDRPQIRHNAADAYYRSRDEEKIEWLYDYDPDSNQDPSDAADARRNMHDAIVTLANNPDSKIRVTR